MASQRISQLHHIQTPASSHYSDDLGGKQTSVKSVDGSGAAEASTTKNAKDAFVTDALQLIGIIYKYAKTKNIPASAFEQIIVRSYDVAWNMEEKSKGSIGK